MGASGLGSLLVKEGLLSEQDRKIIRNTTNQNCWAFAKGILTAGLMDEDELASFLAERTQFRMASRDIVSEAHPDAMAALDAHLLTKMEVFPIDRSASALTIAVVDPLDKGTLRQVEFFSGYKVHPVIATLTEIHEALRTIDESFTPETSDLENFLLNHAGSALHMQKLAEHAAETGDNLVDYDQRGEGEDFSAEEDDESLSMDDEGGDEEDLGDLSMDDEEDTEDLDLSGDGDLEDLDGGLEDLDGDGDGGLDDLDGDGDADADEADDLLAEGGDDGADDLLAEGGDDGADDLLAEGGDNEADDLLAEGGDNEAEGGDDGADDLLAEGGDNEAEGGDDGADDLLAEGGDDGADDLLAEGGDDEADDLLAEGGDDEADDLLAEGGDGEADDLLADGDKEPGATEPERAGGAGSPGGPTLTPDRRISRLNQGIARLMLSTSENSAMQVAQKTLQDAVANGILFTMEDGQISAVAGWEQSGAGESASIEADLAAFVDQDLTEKVGSGEQDGWTDLSDTSNAAFARWVGDDQRLQAGVAKGKGNRDILFIGGFDGSEKNHNDFLESTMGFLRVLSKHLDAS